MTGIMNLHEWEKKKINVEVTSSIDGLHQIAHYRVCNTRSDNDSAIIVARGENR